VRSSPVLETIARRIAVGAVVAGTLSGIPSTIDALVRRRSILESTRAAGTLLGRRSVVRGAVAHAGLSFGWSAVLTALVPRRHEPAWGALAGAGIAALDLGLARLRWPAIAALPTGPQVADHIAFGALVGVALAWSRRADPEARS
jgi:hypothetical protein